MALNQLKAGAALSYVVLGLSNIVALLYTPYMLRMMGQSEYGLYALVSSVIAYLTILDFGFGNAIVRYTAKFKAEGKKDEQYSMFGLFIILYSAIGVIAFLAGLSIYFNVEVFFGETMTSTEIDRAKIMILWMLFDVSITFPLSIFGSIINAYENFVFSKIITIIRIVLSTIVMILLLEIGYRAIGLVVATSVFNFLSLFFNYLYCKKKIKIKIHFKKFEWGFLKEVALYSFFIFLNIIMDRIYWSTGQFILGACVGTVAIAVFSVGISIQSMYMSFSTAISGVFLPRVTAMSTHNESDKAISDLFIRTGRIQYIILSFILTGFILFGKQFISLWAGANYANSYYIALIFLIPLTIPLMQNLGITILQARNQMKFRSLLYIVIAGISLGLQIPLAKLWGGIGVASAISFGLIAGQILGMNIYYYKKQNIDIPQFWLEIAKMSIVPIILGVISFFILQHVILNTIATLALGIIIFSIIYIPTFWNFAMNKSEKELIEIPLRNLYTSGLSRKMIALIKKG